jgi:hypothetical protein
MVETRWKSDDLEAFIDSEVSPDLVVGHSIGSPDAQRHKGHVETFSCIRLTRSHPQNWLNTALGDITGCQIEERAPLRGDWL